jgi:hypothetical protein
MAKFQSKLCNVCRDALEKMFSNLARDSAYSGIVPHHLTKTSLVDSVVAQSCHLCCLIVDYLKVSWSDPLLGLEEEERSASSETVTALSEEKFRASDFEHATFPGDRLKVRRAIGRLPEDIRMTAHILNHELLPRGQPGSLQFNSPYTAEHPRGAPWFLMFCAEGNFSFTTTSEKDGLF